MMRIEDPFKPMNRGRARIGLAVVLGSAMMLALGLLIIPWRGNSAPDLALATTGQTVTWTGNGTNNGYCSSFQSDPDLHPAAGQQGWLFILTSPNSPGLDAHGKLQP